jgi:transcriptional regulator of arginine metabolism
MNPVAVRPDEATERRTLLRAALLEAPARTQAELVAHLKAHGHSVTQSCVSRDLQDIGARKMEGRYRIAPERRSGLPGLAALIEGFSAAGPHLVVVRTLPGGAQRVAHAIDTAQWPEAAGSVAGDDTIFVASHTPSGQQGILERLRAAIRPESPGGSS